MFLRPRISRDHLQIANNGINSLLILKKRYPIDTGKIPFDLSDRLENIRDEQIRIAFRIELGHVNVDRITFDLRVNLTAEPAVTRIATF